MISASIVKTQKPKQTKRSATQTNEEDEPRKPQVRREEITIRKEI